MTESTIHVRYIGAPREATRLLALARTTLAGAEAKAQALESETRRRLAELVVATRNRARARGYAQGTREAKRDLLEALLEHDAKLQRELSNAQLDCLNLAVRVSEEVIGEEIRGNKHSVLQRVQRALTSLVEQRALRLVVSHDDQDAVRSQLAAELSIPVTTADDLSPGDARVETASGSIELRWREHLSTIYQHLRSRLLKHLNLSGDPACLPSDPSLTN